MGCGQGVPKCPERVSNPVPKHLGTSLNVPKRPKFSTKI